MVRWVGQHYYRKRTGDWRNRSNGQISNRPRSSAIRKEPVYGHISGGDKFKAGKKSLSASQKSRYQYSVRSRTFIARPKPRTARRR